MNSPAPEANVEIVDVPEASQFEIRLGGTRVGFMDYAIRGNTFTAIHTEVDPDSGRKGVGSTLVQGALDDVRAKGGSVVAECSFVRGWIAKHEEYADLVV